eukprot:PITA_32746
MGDTMIQSQLEWKISVKEGMEANTIPENFYNRVVRRIFQAFHQYKKSVIFVSRRIWQVGADDPRRVIHSIKVGLALSLVSVFYFVRPLFDSFGGNAIWAVMTVVVVFEFTVGATLSKGLNRSLATVMAGLLGVGVSYVAEFTGKNCERVILTVSVFALGRCILNPNYAIMYGTACTYSRFFPVIKQRYDYGVVIFILTFNLVAISGSRIENILKFAHQRITTIIIGCTLCFIVNLFAFPIWAGDDLHNSIIHNLEGLAESLQECVAEYFVESKDVEDSDDDKVGRGYKCLLNSKTTEESLVGEFREMGTTAWTFFFQTPIYRRKYLKTPCIEIGRESANILCELADSIRTMKSINPILMMDRLKATVAQLQNSLRAQPELFINTENWQPEKPSSTRSIPKMTKQADEENTISFQTNLEAHMLDDNKLCEMIEMKGSRYTVMEVLPLASFSALLIETVARLESVVVAVEELGAEAKFKSTDQPVKEPCPPSLTKTTTSLTSTKQMVATNLPTTTTMTDNLHHQFQH